MAGLLVAIVVGFVAPATAAADSVSSVRSQIDALQSQITSASAHLHQLTVAYDADSLQASELAQQVQAAEGQIQGLQQEIQQNEAVVRRVAVLSYTGEAQQTASLALSPLVGQAYVDATMGNLTDSEDQMRTEQRQVGTQLSALRQAGKAEAAQLAAAATARQGALTEAANEQQALAADQQRLNTLLAQAAASSRPPAVQGLGTGLVDAVRSQVSPGAGQNTLTATPANPPVAAPAARPAAPPPAAAPTGGVWLELRECESGDNYQENTGNGFYGAYQFSQSTWTDLGYPGRPDQESPAMQDAAAMKLQAEAGWGQWPACSKALGL